MKCPVCNEEFQEYEGMRGPAWCEPCQNEFDKIDWDAYFDRRLGG